VQNWDAYRYGISKLIRHQEWERDISFTNTDFRESKKIRDKRPLNYGSWEYVKENFNLITEDKKRLPRAKNTNKQLCPKCGKAYTFNPNRRNAFFDEHVNRVHEFKCFVVDCSFSSVYTSELQIHVRNSHPEAASIWQKRRKRRKGRS